MVNPVGQPAIAADATPEDLVRRVLAETPVFRDLPRLIAYMISLPHRALRPDEVWVKDFGDFAFIVEPGRFFLHGDHRGEIHGVPFGPRARLIFAYFIQEAVSSPTLQVDRGGMSASQWFESLGLSIGGKTYTMVREQEMRVSAARFITTFRAYGYEGIAWDPLYISGMRGDPGLGRTVAQQHRNMVQLSQHLFNELAEHPSRIPLSALAALSNQSLGLDIYYWLAYRLPVLDEPVSLEWGELFRCFGTSYKQMRHFEPRFIEKLEMVLDTYKEAKVGIEPGGIVLYPSPPPQAG